MDKEDQKQSLSNMKIEPERRQHVPYILNGELYRIESQNGDNVTVRCCYCPPDRIYRGSIRSTGNFHMHIKRRHVSLMGKLHEMKVAALLERRDQIAKNRRMAKCRKKSTTSSITATSVESPTLVEAAATPTATTTHQLKIKKVFQRHKQEHHEQEEAAAIRSSISLCDSSQDNISQSSTKLSTSQTQNNNNNNGENNENSNTIEKLNITQKLEDVEKLPELPETTIQLTATLPRPLNINFIKPEQQQQQQPQQSIAVQSDSAIDLSRSSSSSFQSDDMQSIEFTSIQQSTSSGQELTTYLNGGTRSGGDVLMMHIDSTLSHIKDELQARNQIEHKRLLFDLAKFKFEHPNFNFSFT